MEEVKAVTGALTTAKNEKARRSNLKTLSSLIMKCIEENDNDDDDPVFDGDLELASILSAALAGVCRKSLMMDEVGNVTLALRCWRDLAETIEDDDSLRAISKGGDVLNACVEALSEVAGHDYSGDDDDDEEALSRRQWSELVCEIVTTLGAVKDAMDLTKGQGKIATRRLSTLLITSASAGAVGEGVASSAIEALSDNSNAKMLIKTNGFVEKILGLIESHDEGVNEEGVDAVVSLSGALWNFSFQEGLREGMLKENPRLLVRMLAQAKKFLSCDASKKLAASFANFTDDKELDRVIFETEQDIFSAIAEFEIVRSAKVRELGDGISDEDEEDLRSCKKYVDNALDNLVKKGLVEMVADAVVGDDDEIEGIVEMYVVAEVERGEKEERERMERGEVERVELRLREEREKREEEEMTRLALETAGLAGGGGVGGGEEEEEEKKKEDVEVEAEEEEEEEEEKVEKAEGKVEKEQEEEMEAVDLPPITLPPSTPPQEESSGVSDQAQPQQQQQQQEQEHRVSRLESKGSPHPQPPPAPIEAPTKIEEPSPAHHGLKEDDLKRHNEEYVTGLKKDDESDRQNYHKKPASPPREKHHHKRHHHKHHHHRHLHSSHLPLDMKVRLSSKISTKPLAEYTLHDVASLLYHLKLTKYIKDVIIKNQIDGLTLSRAIDVNDVKEIGVTIQVHAKKLLEWIMSKKQYDSGRGKIKTLPLITLLPSQIGLLLRSISLGRYEPTFIQNAIDGETLMYVKCKDDFLFLGMPGIQGMKLLERVKVWRVVGVGVDELEVGNLNGGK
ncbi:hypothetical protein TrLO_g13398 [Triparma laevis f. longispina]|uniref:SAM domain-containing protein n=1 Tax=Triparma laevis f. longispina TaxID=1714387 RepID=A0A9W7KZU0_9STRA|nr:hypothetical protein TrLO_g13398 [Triparma laevis f. longispina]